MIQSLPLNLNQSINNLLLSNNKNKSLKNYLIFLMILCLLLSNHISYQVLNHSCLLLSSMHHHRSSNHSYLEPVPSSSTSMRLPHKPRYLFKQPFLLMEHLFNNKIHLLLSSHCMELKHFNSQPLLIIHISRSLNLRWLHQKVS